MGSKDFKIRTRSFPIMIDVPVSTDADVGTGVILAAYGGGLQLSSNVTEWIASQSSTSRKNRFSNRCMHRRITDLNQYQGPIVFDRNSRVSPTLHSVHNEYLGTIAAGSVIATDAAKTAIGGHFGFDLLANDGQSFMDQNFDRMRPDLTELSVPNFLLDWRQMFDLLKVWNSRKSILKNVAGVNLNYQYGWRPTIADVGSMVASIFSLKQKLENWRRQLGRNVRRRVTVLSTNVSKSATQPYFSGGGSLDWSARLTRQVQAFIVYKPIAIPELTNLELVLRGYLDILGFELNPAIIWDKIPFSFVVDWFLGIGPYLERLKLDTLELPIQLLDSYLQCKEVLSVDSKLTIFESEMNPVVNFPGANHKEEYFHRWQFAPGLSIASNLGWKQPSRNQIGLGLSLLISNAWK